MVRAHLWNKSVIELLEQTIIAPSGRQQAAIHQFVEIDQESKQLSPTEHGYSSQVQVSSVFEARINCFVGETCDTAV